MRSPRRPKKIKQDPKVCPLTILLSTGELELLNSYLERKGIRNRSAYIRRLLMNKVLEDISGNPTTLFESNKFPYE